MSAILSPLIIPIIIPNFPNTFSDIVIFPKGCLSASDLVIYGGTDQTNYQITISPNFILKSLKYIYITSGLLQDII